MCEGVGCRQRLIVFGPASRPAVTSNQPPSQHLQAIVLRGRMLCRRVYLSSQSRATTKFVLDKVTCHVILIDFFPNKNPPPRFSSFTSTLLIAYSNSIYFGPMMNVLDNFDLLWALTTW